MALISIAEYAARHDVTQETIQMGCRSGRFKTAKKIGRNWVIDSNEEMIDGRIKSGKYIGWRKNLKTTILDQYTFINADRFMDWVRETINADVISEEAVLEDLVKQVHESGEIGYTLASSETKSGREEYYPLEHIYDYKVDGKMVYTISGSVNNIVFRDAEGNYCDRPDEFLDNEEYDDIDETFIL